MGSSDSGLPGEATSALIRATAAHRSRWGGTDLVVRAPGRVNLIGEHTDYNDGFTLPMALPFDTVMAISNDGDPREGPITISSEGFGDVVIDVSADPSQTHAWARHLVGVAVLLGREGIPAGGWRAAIATDIPTGASLSSSAAIEVAAITALLARAGTSWPAIDVARLGQRVENEIVGLPSGIMDQFICAAAVADHASLMDCRALTLEHRPLPGDAVIAIMDTGTRRVLAEAAYGERRAACERAASALGVAALRDASLADLSRISNDVDRRRAHHVVTENARTLDAAAAMQRGDSARVGRLMSESHLSLRDEFEVSGAALDHIVEVANQGPGCLGARMTGGGFAGCAVALVAADRVDDFAMAVLVGYRYQEHTARIWICRPSAGASLVDG